MSNKQIRTTPETSEAIESFLDGSILRQPSSVELGWKNLALERRTIMPVELPSLDLDRHYLLLWEGHVAEGEAAYKGGRFSTYKKLPDTLTTCTPGIRPPMRNRSSHEVIVAALDPAYLSSIEDELDAKPHETLQDLYGTGDPDLRNILRLLLHESEAGGVCGPLYAESLTAALATRLVYASRHQNTPAATTASLLPTRALKRVIERMRADLGATLDLATLAAESGYSRAHFLRTFKATTGQTPHRYLNELRLQKARDLVLTESLPLIDIAASCGFSSHGHLTTAFRERFGVPPSQYRRVQNDGTAISELLLQA